MKATKGKAQRALVVDGNKAYRHRVFAIRGAKIVKSWDTEYYLKSSLRTLKQEIPPMPITSQRYIR